METVFASFTSSGITVSSFLLCSLVALLCGALIAFTYTRRTRFTQSLVLAVILLPFAVQTVIMSSTATSARASRSPARSALYVSALHPVTPKTSPSSSLPWPWVSPAAAAISRSP